MVENQLKNQDASGVQLSRREMLSDAKMRIQEIGMDGSKANYHMVQNKTGEEGVVLSSDTMPDLPVLYIQGCSGCSFTLPEGTSVVKVLMEGCRDCTLTLRGKVNTDTLEIWRCSTVQVNVGCSIATIQVDLSEGVHLKFDERKFFGSVVHAGVRKLELQFKEEAMEGEEVEKRVNEAMSRSVGYDVLVGESHPHINDTTDQFITRFVDGRGLLTEQVLRLKNDFPTTSREQQEYADRLASHAQTLGGSVSGVRESLGEHISPEDEEKLKQLQARQEAAAEAARAEAQEEVSNEARVQFKKDQGNEAFKEGRYQDAAVIYTAALALPTSDIHPIIYSNCAACFLKLGRYSQALEHTEASVALAPTNAKAHFRRGLSLQALERFTEAFGAFEKVLEIEPSNGQAKGALQMCQMQIQRQLKNG